MSPFTNVVFLATVVLTVTVAIASKAARKLRPPPGPKPLPLLGNIHQYPQRDAWATFKKWKEAYGDIVYVHVVGKPILVLGSHAVCTDLLEKRSSVYSDRPPLPMTGDLIGMSWAMPVVKYTSRWREQRRLFHQYYSENAVRRYFGVQEECARNFLRRLISDPDGFLGHTRLSFAEPFLRTVYGINAASCENEYVQLLEKTMEHLVPAGIPGRFLVDLLPILKYVPSWMPGAGFQRFADEARVLVQAAKDMPAEFAMQRDVDNTASTVFSQMHSLCERERSNKRPEPESESPLEVTKNVCSVTWLAGSDTTLASIQKGLLLLANNPQVQFEAQAELDSVVGNDRLPTFEDSKDLPYITAIVRELLRCYPVTPVGLPHYVSQDDIYNGYLIPKGTLVLQNLRAILHNPDIYPDPDQFRPSRWLIQTPEGMRINDAIPDPFDAFGYGRRACPGRYFALNALFITISNVLSCFNIYPLDESGKPCERIPERFTDGVVAYPEPYRASIVPRSDKVAKMLEELDV